MGHDNRWIRFQYRWKDFLSDSQMAEEVDATGAKVSDGDVANATMTGRKKSI